MTTPKDIEKQYEIISKLVTDETKVNMLKDNLIDVVELKNILEQLMNYDNKKVTEAVDNKTDTENKEDTEDVEEENPIDTIEEVTEGIKKDLYKYCKQRGLDIEKLQASGIPLEEIDNLIDKITIDESGNSGMVSNSAVEYMDMTGQTIDWDYEINNNSLKIVIQEVQ